MLVTKVLRKQKGCKVTISVKHFFPFKGKSLQAGSTLIHRQNKLQIKVPDTDVRKLTKAITKHLTP